MCINYIVRNAVHYVVRIVLIKNVVKVDFIILYRGNEYMIIRFLSYYQIINTYK